MCESWTSTSTLLPSHFRLAAGQAGLDAALKATVRCEHSYPPSSQDNTNVFISNISNLQTSVEKYVTAIDQQVRGLCTAWPAGDTPRCKRFAKTFRRLSG
jgi:hypothetical protein